jgi:hypothetical protein
MNDLTQVIVVSGLAVVGLLVLVRPRFFRRGGKPGPKVEQGCPGCGTCDEGETRDRVS